VDSYRAPGTYTKLKPLQDLSIRVNPEVTEEVVHHAGLRVDGSLHLRLHVCKVIHPSLESSDPFDRVLSLVNPITGIPLQWSVPVREPGRGRGFGSEARLGVTMSGRNYDPYGDPSSHPHTQCPTGALEGDLAV
jgi:hypothetical protein